MSEKILNESEFQGDKLRERIKTLIQKHPEYSEAFSSVVDDTRKQEQDLKREIVFQKIPSLGDYKNIKNEYDALTNGQRKRIQLALGFRGNLVDGIFGARMFIALKTLPEQMKKYSLEQLSYTDANGQNLEIYNQIISQLGLTNPQTIRAIQEKLKKEGKKIIIDGELGPVTLGLVKESFDKQGIQTVGVPSGVVSFQEPNRLSVPISPVLVPNEKVGNTVSIDPLYPDESTRAKKYPTQPVVTGNLSIDTTSENRFHRAVQKRDINVQPVSSADKIPEIKVPDTQIGVIPQINPADIHASIQREIQTQNIQKIRGKLGLQEGDTIERTQTKKEEFSYIIRGSDKAQKVEITDNDTEKYFLAQFLYNQKEGKVLSSPRELNSLNKKDKSQISDIIGIDLSKIKGKKQYAKFKESDLSKLFTLKELGNATKIEDAAFIKLFSKDGIEKGDIIFTNEEGVTFVYNNNTKKLLVRKETDFPLESNYEKFTLMKGEFSELKLQEKQKQKQKLFLSFGIEDFQIDFPSFYEKVMNKDLFQSIDSLKDIIDGKVFLDKDVVDSKFGLLKYGIDAVMMQKFGIQNGDSYRYDTKTKKLIVFRQSNDGIKEEIGSEMIIKTAFLLQNIDAIKKIFALESSNPIFIANFREFIRKNRTQAREIFFNLPLSLAGGDIGKGRNVNFYGSPHLQQYITPYDLFGDYKYLKMNGLMYKRAPENGDEKEGDFEEIKTLEERLKTGDFYSKSGSKMKLRGDKIGIITDITSEEIQSFEKNFDIDTLLRVLETLKDPKKQKEFITLKQKEFITFIKSTIKVGGLSSKMREKFLSNPFDKFFQKITLQEGNQNIGKLHPLLKESLTMYEFFGDKPYIKVDGVLYKNDGNTFRDQYGNEVKKLSEVTNISLQVESRDLDSFKDIIGYMRSGNFGALESFALSLPPEIRKNFSNNVKQIIQALGLQANLRETFLKDGVFSVEKGTFMENLLSTKELFAPNEKYIKVDKDIYIANGDGTYSSLMSEKTLKLVSGMQLEIVKNIEGLRYTPLAREFGAYTVNNFKYGGKLSTGTTGCGKGTGDTITAFRIRGFTVQEFGSSRDGYLWKGVLDEAVDAGQMIRVKVNHPDEAKAGAIIPYNRGARLGTKNRRLYGHVEIKGSDGKYRHANEMPVAAGSSHTSEKNPAKYMKLTGFYGYVYYPVRKAS